MAELGSEGIWLSNDRVRQLNADLFEQSARQTLGDVWEQQATAAAPDMVRQAQQDEQQRQAAIDAQRQQEQQDRQNTLADSFLSAAPQMAAEHVANLTGDPDLAAHLGNALASPSPQDALQPTSAADTSQTPVTDVNPTTASPAASAAASPPVTPTSPLPSSFAAPVTPTAPVTAPLPNPPAATQQPIAIQPATQTTVGLSGGVSDSRLTGPALNTLGLIGSTAQQYGLGNAGAQAAQAVGLTEGALVPRDDRKDIGDNGNSFGWAQLHRGGQLPNFAADMGMSQDQAGEYARQNPDVVAQWALSPTGTNGWQRNGYLGNAIRAGLSAGLTGAGLATYAQQHGQVSVSPERAGQNFQALFGAGQDILGGIGNAIGGAVQTAGKFVGDLVPNQFGDPSLSTDEAYAACGPAAAIAFARANGRNPTLREAVDMAKSVGWTTAGGMNGIANEKALLDKMGIASTLDSNPSWSRIAADASSGNPVAISTPNHYFVADGYDSQTGKYHVGASGTAFKAGAEWMTAEQISQLGGGVNGALFADHPSSPTPSVAVADQQAQAPVTNALSQLGLSTGQQAAPSQPQSPLDAFKQKIGDAFSDLLAPIHNLFGGSSQPPAPEGGGYGAVPPGGTNPLPDVFGGVQSPQTGNPVVDVLGTGASALGSAVHAVGRGLEAVSPGGGAAVTIAGSDQLAQEFAARGGLQLQAQLQDLQQRRLSGEQGLESQIQTMGDQLNAINHEITAGQPYDQAVQDAAQRNPNLPALQTVANVGTAALATPLAAEGAPLAFRAAAEALAPGTNPAALIGQAAGDVARVGRGLAAPVDTTAARAVDTPLPFTPSLVDSGPLSLTPVVVRGAAAGGAAGGYQASQQPGATPADVATGVLTGAGLGAARGAITSVLPGAGRVVGPLARIASEPDAGGRVPLTGAGILQGALDALGQYPAEARQAIEDTVAKAQAEGTAASTVGAMVQRWIQQNPLSNFRQPPSSSTTDVLQGLLDQARTRGANPQVLDSMQGQLEQLKTVASSATSTAANGAAATSTTLTARGLPGVSELLGPSGPQPGQLSLGLDVPELHPRIQELLGDHPEYAQIAQDGLVDLINSKADLGAIGRYWAGVQASAGVPTGITPMDWIRALRYGAMAGGLQTLGHVGLSVPLQTLWSIPREAVASVLRGKPEQIPATIAGTFKGFAAGWEAASQQLRYGLTEGEAMTGDISQASKALQATSPLQAGAYRAAEGLVSTHGLGQMMIENVGFYQKLVQQAWSMAKNEGLTGSAFNNRVEDIISNVTVDPKYQDLLKEAQQYGLKMAFRGPQGKLGEKARGIASAGITGNLLIPFETIAYHVLTQGVERTPLGILGTALDVARAKTPLGNVLGAGPYETAFNAGTGAVTPLAERMANNVLGLGMLAAGLEAASRGLVTGAGPEDPTERRTWLDQGNQPDSFLIGGRYVSSHTFGPLAYPFQVAAAAVEAAKYAKPGTTPEQVMADGLRRMGQYLTNETWLRGVGQITDALAAQGGAGSKVARGLANLGESFVPQSALLHNVEQATDPLVRQPTPGDVAEQFQSYYPGLAGQLPPRQSLLGEPVANPNQGLGVLAPTARGGLDPVVQLFANAGMGVPNPPPQIKVTSKYSMDLQPAEQRQYQDLRGQALRELTQEFVDEPAFASLPIEKQRTYLQKAMTRADDIARKQFLDAMPDDQIEQRVLAYQGIKAPRPFASVGSP